jgi:membrane peptidoglycan carboxypeptidase
MPDHSRNISIDPPVSPMLRPEAAPARRPAFRSRKQRLASRSRQQHLLKALLLACLTAALLAGGLFSWGWIAAPSVSDLQARVQAVDRANDAPYTPLAQISPLISHALIATEDERFYQHHGIDVVGLARAAWDDLLAGKLIEGGSTLTEQLAKDVYLHGDDHTFSLKLEDMLLALKIEAHYSKSQILAFYLNRVYFGEGAYGIGAAAQRYFHRSPAQVDLAQAALLAGLVQAPSLDDPLCHPNAARARQQQVLDRMLSVGDITAAQAARASQETLTFWSPATGSQNAFCNTALA